jgi:TetR/AcrR family transcriptional repressor of lmrAB and yxaGH operons
MTDQSQSNSTTSIRDRLIEAMLDALKTKGFHGVGLNELLAKAKATKGVLYHHFPGGKSELAIAAINVVALQITTGLEKLLMRQNDIVIALDTWINTANNALAGSCFEQGCPLATIALETTANDIEIRLALSNGFASIRATLAKALESAGIKQHEAGNLSALIVSAYEGALIQGRVSGSSDTMRSTTDALLEIIQLKITNSDR